MKVNISEEIVEKLKKRVEGSDEFKDVEEYVNYALKQVVEKLEGEKRENKSFSKEDEEGVRKKLRGLGYLE